MGEKHKDADYLFEQYVEKGKSTTEIGEELGVNQGTVWYWLDKHDIQRRGRVEAIKDAVGVSRANYYTNDKGYPLWKASVGDGKEKVCYVSRLLAVAEYGFDKVRDKEIHHKNEIPWDNRPENIQPMDNAEHMNHHHSGVDHWEDKHTPWRDEWQMKRLYEEKKLSCAEIADMMDVAASTIQRWVRKHGMEVRPAHVQRDEY